MLAYQVQCQTIKRTIYDCGRGARLYWSFAQLYCLLAGTLRNFVDVRAFYLNLPSMEGGTLSMKS